jgi:hypothetical protein
VDCFLERHADVLADLDRIRAWDEVIALDPRLGAWLPEEALDRALQAFADFADLQVAAPAVAFSWRCHARGGRCRSARVECG